MSNPPIVGFIGLGVMGFPMARHLAVRGHPIAVFNRTRTKAEAFIAAHGGALAATPAEAANGAEFVMICVGRDQDLEAVTLGDDGAFAALAPGAVVIDHTTASAEIARRLALEAKARGAAFLDAPVSGGQAGAENGQLTCMVGGDTEAFTRAQAPLLAYCRLAKLLGPSGSGQLAKMVNQICIAGVVQGLAEALGFAQKAGLDGPAVVEAISKGAAQSWQMDNRALSMLEGRFDFGFAVDWMRKDLDLALAEARRNGASLPLAALVDQFYADLQARGHARSDTSSLIARL